ncbi:MAG: WD40 repeat domain-containing protein [Trueperaceae bacterium]|nr:WD40 repeat domain-containing protein [Trueperaceae bacterium]
MSEERVEGLLRIRNASQDIVGVAFLVKRGDGKPAYRALTCAHVVLAALGIHKDIDKNDHIRTSMPTQEIDLDFVYADTPDTPVKARVEAWYPQPAPHVDPHGALEDIAVLYLEPKYIPKNVQHYLLQTPDQFPGHEISVGFYGFPEGYDGVQGNTIDTTISKTSLALGWHKIATDEVVPGYSGAPVWAYQTNEKIVEKIEDKKIVGMIVANNTVKVKVLKNAVAVGTDKTVQIVPGQAVSGYMISTSILKQALPILSKNPYRGLDAFKKEDGKYFFGRESDANRLYERLGKKHPIAVVSGKSGSGKSSLVSAGLLPLLEEKDSGSWRTIAFRPQEEPFVELARGITDGLPESVKDGVVPKFTSPEELTTPLYALARLLKMEAEDLQIKMEAEDLQKTDGPVSGRNILHSLAEKLKKETRQSLLLVADQFEEAYTLSGKTSEMSKTSRIFTDYLIHSIKSQPSRLTIGLVLTIREDFLGTLLSDTKFTEVLEANIHTLKGIQDLDQVIKKPAEMKNVTLEPTLARRILDDLEHSNDQGSLDSFAKLPLLQFALTELWKEQHYQDGRYTLTESNYTTLRGAKGVLGEYAEKFFDKHDKTEQEALRRIFSEKLIVVRKRNDPLAKRVETKKSFSSEEWGLIRDLNDKRLVTIGRDKERKIETVEISHEALIGGWKRLRDWIDEDQDFLSWLTSLRQPLDKWYNANKDPDYLLIGKDLADAENKLKDENFGKRISGKAREFIESSIAERDRKEKQENARKTQQNVTIIATTLIAIFIALFIPRFFVLQNREQAAGSLAGQLSAQAQREIQGANSAVDVTKALLTLSEALHVYPSRLYREAFSSATQVLSNIPSYFYTSLQGHSGDVNSVALNLDGSVLASASADNTIILWDLGNPQSPAQLAPPLTEHSGPVRSVAFNYDGSVLASGSDDNTIILWDISNPQNSTQLAPPLTEHSGGVTSVAFNHDGSVLASASVDNTIILWDISNPQNSTQLAPPLTEHRADVASVAFSHDGSILASGSWDGTIILWDLSNPQSPAQLAPPLTGHSGGVESIAFNHNSSILASGSWDGAIILWDISGPQNPTQLAPSLTEHSDWVTSVAFNHDGSVLASGSDDNTIILWDISNPQNPTQLAPPLTGHGSNVESVVFNHDGSVLASGSDDSTIILWDITTRSPTQLTPPLTGYGINRSNVESVAFNHDDSILASGSRDNTITLWDITRSSTQLTPPLTGHSGGVESVAFNHDDSILASGSRDNTIILWDVSDPRNPTWLAPPLIKHSGDVESVAFNHDSSVLASGSDDSTIILWDISNPRNPARLAPPLAGHGSRVYSVAFNHDGSVLASASADGFILWDVSDPKNPSRITQPLEKWVYSVAFNHDSSVLASASADGLILWDISDPKP